MEFRLQCDPPTIDLRLRLGLVESVPDFHKRKILLSFHFQLLICTKFVCSVANIHGNNNESGDNSSVGRTSEGSN